ncbi:MAG: hypothetical protein ACLFR0_05965 [Alphaproteobacteria bacterium]
MKKDNEQGLDYIQRYISICNVALHKNCERFPFKQILDAAEQQSKGRMIEVNIEGDPPHEEDYVFTLSQGRIQADKHACGSQCTCDGKWIVKKAYIEDVINNPDIYIQNPAKINWEWLYS